MPNNGLQMKISKVPGAVHERLVNSQNQTINSASSTNTTFAIIPKITTTSTVTIPNQSAVASSAVTSSMNKVNNSKSNKKRSKEQQQQQSQVTTQHHAPSLITTSNTTNVTPATVTATIPPCTTKMVTIPATQLSAILTQIPSKKLKLEPGSVGTFTINSHLFSQGSVLGCSKVATSSSSISVSQLTVTTSPSSSSISSSISSSSNIATIATPSSTTPNSGLNSSSLKSPSYKPMDQSIMNNISNDLYPEHESMEVDSSSAVKAEATLTSTTTNNADQSSMTTLMIKTYQNEDSVCVKKEVIDSKDDILVAENTTQHLGPSNSVTVDDGLVIVPLEKGMQMVQESIRPRKEMLRKRFNELLDSCLTESDIELVEQTIEQLISTNLLQ